MVLLKGPYKPLAVGSGMLPIELLQKILLLLASTEALY